jgi:hypothetical protein
MAIGKKEVKKIADTEAIKAVDKHEKRMHPGKKVTKMAAGGKTNEGMLETGRNREKYKNQFGSIPLKGKGF